MTNEVRSFRNDNGGGGARMSLGIACSTRRRRRGTRVSEGKRLSVDRIGGKVIERRVEKLPEGTTPQRASHSHTMLAIKYNWCIIVYS